MYVTNDSADAALASYDAKMETSGWAIIDPPLTDRPDLKGHWYEHQGSQAMVSASRNNEGQTVMVVGDLGAKLEKAPSVEVLP